MRRLIATALVALLVGGAGGWRLARRQPRTEHVVQAKQERKGEAKSTAQATTAATTEARAVELVEEETTTKRPDGTVSVTKRRRVKQAEAKKQEVKQEKKEAEIKWFAKAEWKEKLVHVPSQSKPPRWFVGIGPAWVAAGGLRSPSTTPDGVAAAAGARVVGPLWLHLQVTRAAGKWTGAALVGAAY